MEAILEKQRMAHGGPLNEELLKAKEEAAEALAAGLEAFRSERAPSSTREAAILLKALLTLRAHTAASVNFESLRFRLAETLERLHKPGLVNPAAYDQLGCKHATAPAFPTKLDKTF